ncbi:MAG: tRNA (uridine(34)/cytosine(34)/5-carboxymethylaminomethyluridine(34)-2'-O)-methyltransferase TrmL [Bacillota bacterium]
MNIVLCNPEIPQNTGNIARTCAATGSSLHIVLPMGFSVQDRHLKRAGLDYWHMTPIFYYDDFESVLQEGAGKNFYFLSTRAGRAYDAVRYHKGDYLVFGSETKGLDEAIIRRFYDKCLRIPMKSGARSLNLANSVAVVVYEALRQNGFSGLV